MSDQASTTKKRALAVDCAILPRSAEIGDGLWVALWAYDRATRQCVCRDGTLVGLVLGGAAITDERIAGELRRSIKWVRRWRVRAVKADLLRVKRFPYGNVLAVILLGKKFSKHAVTDAPAWAQSPTPPKVTKRARPKSRVPTLGLSEVPKGVIQSAQIGVSERTKVGTRRKTLTMTTQQALEQKTFPPSPYVPPTGGYTSQSRSKSTNAPATLLAFQEQTKPKKPTFELAVEKRSLTAFGHVVWHFAGEEGVHDLAEITVASVQHCRQTGIEIPTDPAEVVNRILRRRSDESD